jgi:hypothetical protein
MRTQSAERTPITAVRRSSVSRTVTPVGRFLAELGGMCAVMCVGGSILSFASFGAASWLGYSNLAREAPELSAAIGASSPTERSPLPWPRWRTALDGRTGPYPHWPFGGRRPPVRIRAARPRTSSWRSSFRRKRLGCPPGSPGGDGTDHQVAPAGSPERVAGR